MLRVIQGLGLGGELPVAATYINEISRAHGRGRFVLLYEIVFPVGLLASNALGAWIVPRFGWQAMYFIGGMPLILFFVLRKLVPESPRWLAERERMADADAAVHAFERAVKGPLPPVANAAEFEAMANRHPKRRMSDLFGPAYLKRTMAVAMLWITCGFIQYGLSTWLPTIYRTVYHAPLQLALNLAVAASVLGVVGSLTCALLVDKVGRKPIINLSFVACALSLLLAGVFHDSSVYVVATCCAFSLGLPCLRLHHGLCVHAGAVSDEYPCNGLRRRRRVAEGGGDLRAGYRVEDDDRRQSGSGVLYPRGCAVHCGDRGALSWD